MPSKSYWQKRFENLKSDELLRTNGYLKELEQDYAKTQASLKKDLAYWYQRFADNNGISYVEAQRKLKANELEELRWTLDEYIKYGKENAINGKWIQQLENASAKYHISRLESLELQLKQHAEVLHARQESVLAISMEELYKDGYYHTAYELQKGMQVGIVMNQFDDKTLNTIIHRPWHADGRDFSQRIWSSRDDLVRELHTELTHMAIRGDAPDKAIGRVAKRFDVSKSRVVTLVQTEHAAMAEKARADCFNDLGVERYIYIATLDSKTSEICQDLDGEHFDEADREIGINSPPMHPRCRSTTAPYFDDMETTRFARDMETGKGYTIPGNISYKEWEKQFVKKKSKPYTDITSKWKPVDPSQSKIVKDLSEWTYNGETYKVDGKHVVLDYSKHEKEVADLLAKKYGKDVRMVPRVTKPEKVKTPDYLIDGEKWDLKTLKSSGENTFYNMTKNKKEQAQNFIFDISNLDVSDEWAENQVSSIFASNNRRWADKIMVLKNDDVKIYKRT